MAYKERHNRWTELWMKFVTWREHHIKEKSFMVILALVIGIACGLAAQLLKYLIGAISGLLTAHFNTTQASAKAITASFSQREAISSVFNLSSNIE